MWSDVTWKKCFQLDLLILIKGFNPALIYWCYIYYYFFVRALLDADSISRSVLPCNLSICQGMVFNVTWSQASVHPSQTNIDQHQQVLLIYYRHKKIFDRLYSRSLISSAAVYSLNHRTYTWQTWKNKNIKNNLLVQPNPSQITCGCTETNSCPCYIISRGRGIVENKPFQPVLENRWRKTEKLWKCVRLIGWL